MKHIALCAALVAALSAAAPPSPSPAEREAVAAMVTSERAHGESDIETPTCNVVQTWALCGYAEGHGEAYAVVIMRSIAGKWKVVKHTGGVETASALEQLYGVPPDVAKKLAPGSP